MNVAGISLSVQPILLRNTEKYCVIIMLRLLHSTGTPILTHPVL